MSSFSTQKEAYKATMEFMLDLKLYLGEGYIPIGTLREFLKSPLITAMIRKVSHEEPKLQE